MFSVSRHDVMLVEESQDHSTTTSTAVQTSEEPPQDCINFSGQLRVEFSTGAVQVRTS